MDQYSALPSLLGRILLAAIFLLSGYHKLMDPQGTQEFMISMGMTTVTTLFYWGAVAIEIGGGLSLLFGFMTRTGALVLALFMIPTTAIFHINFSDPNQMIHFLKNLAMTGGLMYVMTYGPGRLSVDGSSRRALLNESLMVAQEHRRRYGETGT